ncbi:ATP-binding protein [Salisediminibacterium selenitireducens]|uniref:Anti-sigma regulatory factor, serine/threonine protein kinase n=1 Tax=Bacillus selenitireducens (strain ATCC 700615 / DSM 15326 / MLS10) TaxID=439292 RepID=D6XY95_BACIE|nr:ATP-binding protein [Salisediminibacterium selenitireducens]ADH98168.1 putative anti-sigma regulatory factor, serine/threonine protein kinase [[Bacillus] selenitireducens MLS10]
MLHSFEANADPVRIHELITQASSALTDMQIPDDGTLTLVIHEAVINAYEACLDQGITDKPIRVTIEMAGSDLLITVSDPAGNLDPGTLDEASQRLDEANLNLHESGRGLFFIQSLMDDVYVQPIEDASIFKQKLIMRKVI